MTMNPACGGWKRRLVFVWGGEFASVLTSSILQMGLIWHITVSTGSASLLALCTLAAFLPMALFGAFAGTIVDRISIKRAMIGADLFIAAVSLALGIVCALGKLEAWMVITVCFVRALGSTLHTPAFNALTPLVAPPEALTRLAGLNQFLQSGGYILGTAAAAVVYPTLGLTFMVALDVGGALVATAAVLLSRIETPARAVRADGQDADAAAETARGGLASVMRAFAAETREGYREFKQHKGLFAMLWIGFAFSVMFSPVSALFPLMTLGHFAGTTTHAAIAEIVFSVGMIATSAVIGTTGGFKNRGFSCALAIALYGAATLASGLLAPSMLIAFFVMAFVMGLSSPLYSSPQVALMQERTEPTYLGRAFGLYGAVCSWAMPAGLIATTLFADTVGVTTCFVAAGVGMVALSVVTWAIPSVRHIDDVRES